ncbi:hypothetical protein [Sporisorium scitamineum]|uniref:Uncharacterized protein n=1 Tax=Sporisorium scitamineum TaxID=49012 RepID=A0A0F7RXM8_9BASI|nr:hypothetical protein [Sporisorium scitamineum]
MQFRLGPSQFRRKRMTRRYQLQKRIPQKPQALIVERAPRRRALREKKLVVPHQERREEEDAAEEGRGERVEFVKVRHD